MDDIETGLKCGLFGFFISCVLALAVWAVRTAQEDE